METIEYISNHGFTPDEITDDQWVLGSNSAFNEQTLVPDANWTPYLPVPEMQLKFNIETSNCTAFNTENPISILIKRKYGYDTDYSERAIGILAGTYPPGNTPHKVAEAIRKNGLIPEKDLPFDTSIATIEQYYQKSKLTAELKLKALAWLDIFDFQHDWVFSKDADLRQKQERMKEALLYSPLGVSVVAWKERGGKFFKNIGEPDTHWCVCIGYEEGKWWRIFDSYDQTIKYLEWNYDFGFAKRYAVNTKVGDPQRAEKEIRVRLSIFEEILSGLKRLFV